MKFKPFDRMWERVESQRDISDQAYFNALMYTGELVVKFSVAGMVAAVNEGPDRQQYRLRHKLVRASGVGEWAQTIDEILTGVPAQNLMTEAQTEAQQLTQKVKAGEWQHDCVAMLDNCLKRVEPDSDDLQTKVAGRQWFGVFAALRNRIRGHGAASGNVLGEMCDDLHRSILLFVDSLYIYQREWAFLTRTLRGRYQITRWTEGADRLNFLKTRDALPYNFEDGVYVYFGGDREIDAIRQVKLVFSDPDAIDYYLPNGKFDGKRFKVLSYITDESHDEDASPYLKPITDLAPSETQGREEAEQHGTSGGCIANLPPPQQGYIQRPLPEQDLYNEVIQDNQHRIVTLIGRGGIGKTWLALQVLNQIADEEGFNAILWFSSRDIDLLPDGAKQVKPHVLTEADIAKEFARLVGPYFKSYDALHSEEFNALTFLRDHLGRSDLGRILFVFDNFETVTNPQELYAWIDTYLRLPNKALITTRFRDFRGDYPVEVKGMALDECTQLIKTTARILNITHLINEEYIQEVYDETGGHPYVIKILLGELKKTGKIKGIERIIAKREDMLDTLFERTYSRLSPVAQRVFLTLCSWKSLVAQTAIEAVLLRPANEIMDITQAIDDLHNSSLIERIAPESSKEDEVYLTVPLVAMQFGLRKLSVNRMQMAIKADVDMLRYFGSMQQPDIGRGIEPRIRRMFKEIEKRIRAGQTINEFIEVIGFIARRYPYAWILLGDIYASVEDIGNADEVYRKYLEFSEDLDGKRVVWSKLISLYSRQGWVRDELFAHIQLAQLPNVEYDTISSAANRFNGLAAQSVLTLDEGEKLQIVSQLIELMESRINEARATDCSRLGWLYMHTAQLDKAREVVERGLQMDMNNDYCNKLLRYLNSGT